MENVSPPLFCLLIKNTWQKLSKYYNHRLVEYRLSVPKALLLLEISPDNGINPHTLADKLDLENSSMSGLLDRLEKGNYIERRRDPDDRRGVLIFLTPSGISAREKIKALVEEMDRKLQEALTAEEIKSFRRISAVIGKQIIEQSR
jgi:DNA-binding MarR family transcriptional regulator